MNEKSSELLSDVLNPHKSMNTRYKEYAARITNNTINITLATVKGARCFLDLIITPPYSAFGPYLSRAQRRTIVNGSIIAVRISPSADSVPYAIVVCVAIKSPFIAST